MLSLYIDIIYYSFLSYYYIVATLSSHVVAVTYVAIFVVAKYKNTISIQHDCAKVQKKSDIRPHSPSFLSVFSQFCMSKVTFI